MLYNHVLVITEARVRTRNSSSEGVSIQSLGILSFVYMNCIYSAIEFGIRDGIRNAERVLYVR